VSGKSIKSVSRGRASGCGTTGEREGFPEIEPIEKANQTLAENKEKKKGDEKTKWIKWIISRTVSGYLSPIFKNSGPECSDETPLSYAKGWMLLLLFYAAVKPCRKALFCFSFVSPGR
jgi:hypothetical protein